MRRRKSVELFERKETTIWMNSCLEASVSMGSYRFKLRSNGLLWCSMDQTLNRKVRNIPYILKMLSDSARTFFRFINQHLIPTLVLSQLRFNWFKKINVHEFPFSQPLEDVFERQTWYPNGLSPVNLAEKLVTFCLFILKKFSLSI